MNCRVDTTEFVVFVGGEPARSFPTAPEACIYAAARYGGAHETVTVHVGEVCIWEDGRHLTI